MENKKVEGAAVKDAAVKPAFLQSLVKPLEERAEMGKGTGKMCSCFSYGS